LYNVKVLKLFLKFNFYNNYKFCDIKNLAIFSKRNRKNSQIYIRKQKQQSFVEEKKNLLL